MYHIKCNDCGYSRDVSIDLEYADNKCLNCTSINLEIIKSPNDSIGDNYPIFKKEDLEKCYKTKNTEFEEIKNIKAPKITKDDVEDLMFELNLKKVTELIGGK